MTRLDVTALAGDPTLSQSEEEWCSEMTSQMKSSLLTMVRLWDDMSGNEQEMMRAYWTVQEETEE